MPKKSVRKSRALSAYNQFVKKEMKNLSGPVTERMKKIAKMWRASKSAGKSAKKSVKKSAKKSKRSYRCGASHEQ